MGCDSRYDDCYCSYGKEECGACKRDRALGKEKEDKVKKLRNKSKEYWYSALAEDELRMALEHEDWDVESAYRLITKDENLESIVLYFMIKRKDNWI